MRKIFMNKFGKFLSNRDEGRNAYPIIRQAIEQMADDEKIFVEFEGVLALNPSFCDELFGSLHEEFPDKIIISKNIGTAFKAAFDTVEETRGTKFSFGEYRVDD